MKRERVNVKKSSLPPYLSYYGGKYLIRRIRSDGHIFWNEGGQIIPPEDVRVYRDEPEKTGWDVYLSVQEEERILAELDEEKRKAEEFDEKVRARNEALLAKGGYTLRDGHVFGMATCEKCKKSFEYCAASRESTGMEEVPRTCPDCTTGWGWDGEEGLYLNGD